jgi:hypothetical protein
MSPVNCTKAPRTGSLRRRLLAGAIAATAVSTSGFPAGPVFAQNIVVSGGAVQSNSTPTTYDSIEVYGTDGSSNPSTYNADAALTLTGNLSAHNSGVFNANANVSVGTSAGSYFGGVINFNAGTLTAGQFNFDGVGSVTRSAGNYSADRLNLANGAALTYGSGDAIANSVSVSGGSTLTLDQNLTLSGNLSLSDGGSISRTTETVEAFYFNVSNATLDLLAGDSFTPGYTNYVQNGAIVNAPAGTSLGSLNVYGINGNGDRATFNVNGDVTVNGGAAAYSDGVLNLIAGTLSAPSLVLGGVGSAGQSGGHYDVTNLSLYGGATLSFGIGDSIDSLSINEAGSRLNGLAPLTLSSLTILNGGNLHLGDFTGSGAIANWGLRMAGDGKTFLENLIFAGLITDGPSPLQVIFDPISNMTYVTSTPGAVPEIDPDTAHGVVMLLVGAAGILERRLRRVALARQAS